MTMDERGKISKNVYVGESKIHGTGVFANRNFKRGELILEIDDTRVVDEENPLDPELGEFDYHCDYLENGKTVLMRSPERHINSSCDPNVFVKTIDEVRFVVALKNIKSDEEIAYDYIIDCHEGEVWECSCGSDRCRKQIVSSFFELPTKLQLEYLPLLNNWFIREHLEKVENLRNLSKK